VPLPPLLPLSQRLWKTHKTILRDKKIGMKNYGLER